jgi:hypothetical protein
MKMYTYGLCLDCDCGHLAQSARLLQREPLFNPPIALLLVGVLLPLRKRTTNRFSHTSYA